MDAGSGQYMGAQRFVERREDHRAGTDLVGQRRQAELDTLAGITLALAVDRLMLAVLLEQDHCQQVGAGPAAGHDVERCRRLANALAGSAGELLAHRLDYLPLSGHDLQRLGDVLADLGQSVRTTAGAGRRPGHHDALARQVRWERLASRLLARERSNCGAVRRRLGRECILGRRDLELLEL